MKNFNTTAATLTPSNYLYSASVIGAEHLQLHKRKFLPGLYRLESLHLLIGYPREGDGEGVGVGPTFSSKFT